MSRVGTGAHFAIQVNDDRDVVEMWSTERLPYEPKGWMLDMRSSLRDALRQMRARDDALLAGVYGCKVDEYCDVENVLIYNVGASNFAQTSGNGLRLERGRLCPHPPSKLDGGGALHYSCYSQAPVEQGFALWRRGATLATWSGIAVPALSEATKPASFWHAVRTSSVDVAASADQTTPFGLELVVGAPRGERMQPAKLIKPLVDGVIAALHCHDGSELENLAQRLSAQLPDTRQADIEALLVDEHSAPLGRRRLLWPRSASVQWNPADDLCVALVAGPRSSVHLL